MAWEAVHFDAMIGNAVEFGSGPAAVTGYERRNISTVWEKTAWEGAASRFEPGARRPALR